MWHHLGKGRIRDPHGVDTGRVLMAERMSKSDGKDINPMFTGRGLVDLAGRVRRT